MSEEFVNLYKKSIKSEHLLWKYLCRCIGKTYKFTNIEEEVFYITVDYFRDFDSIGISHITERGIEESHVWDVHEFYEIIKDSVEIG